MFDVTRQLVDLPGFPAAVVETAAVRAGPQAGRGVGPHLGAKGGRPRKLALVPWTTPPREVRRPR